MLIMHTCPKCKKVITAQGSYCKHCGTFLETDNFDDEDELIEEFHIIELTEDDEE